MRILFFLLSCLFSFALLAQEADTLALKPTKILAPNQLKRKFKSVSVSFPYKKFRDEGHSPLLYRGPSFQVAAYNERWRTKSITKFEMVMSIGTLRSNKHHVSAVTVANNLELQINYHYFRPFGKIFNGKGDFYAGAILSNIFDGRLYSFLPNNSFGYEFSNSINPAGHITYNFKLGKSSRNYQGGFKLNFSLLAHVIRPNFIGMEPSETYMQEKVQPFAIFLYGNKVALPNRYFRLNTEIYLDRFKLVNNDKIRFFYGWGMHVTKLPNSNPLYYAYHSVGIVSMLYSEKPKKKFKKQS